MIGPQPLIVDEAQPKPMDQSRIMVVDDDPWICRLLTRLLAGEGFAVETVTSGRLMWQKLKIWPCDLLILDLRLPAGEDGLDLAQSIRKESDVGLIMLSGRSECVDKIVGLEIGADDYVTKPFEPRELLARIRSVLRRVTQRWDSTLSNEESDDLLHFAGWMFDLEQRKLTSSSGKDIALTTYEFELLAALATRPGRPLSRESILELIAHRQWDPDNRSIDVLVGKLRRKLGDDARAPQLIKTVRGHGYVFTGGVDRAD